jgi:archaellum component FlaC
MFTDNLPYVPLSGLNKITAVNVSKNVDTISGNVISLSNTTQQVQGQITTLSSNVNVLSGNITLLSNTTQQVQAQVNTLSTNLSSNVNALSDNISLLAKTTEQVTAQVSTVSSNINALSGNVTLLSTNLSSNINALSGNITSLKQKLEPNTTTDFRLLMYSLTTIVEEIQDKIVGLDDYAYNTLRPGINRVRGLIGQFADVELERSNNISYLPGGSPTGNVTTNTGNAALNVYAIFAEYNMNYQAYANGTTLETS